jgi:hypothetical protein
MKKKNQASTIKSSGSFKPAQGGKMRPKVTFRNKDSACALTDKEIESKLARGAVIHNTSRSIYQAKKRPGYGAKAPQARSKLAPRAQAAYALAPSQAIQTSGPSLDRSDESAIAINPSNLKNIVAGAATFDGTQFTNSAYVSMDAGNTWKTVTALTNTSEGAGIAFDDSGNCYYVTMQGGFNPCCVISRDGGLTWSAPAFFGSGDKTAVAARGQIALCGFDRLNTEACAFTLDGGMSWTVHDFTDSGIGTAPLVSYDQNYFYIIYAALDNNLKIYASPDQGQTWNGPTTIVAGNATESAVPGPLSYQGGALTSPGTNVAIDASGTLHVLYVDSVKQTPMYTSSSDHGATWSAPVNVNPERASDAHMFPCLSCNKHGDLLAGSLVYDQTLGKYSILRHVKTHQQTVWTTIETDNGPWAAAGPSTGFRIGFGDYFDCDTPPQCGISAMAWSETPNGQEPWQTWARILDPICEQERKDRCPCAVELPGIPRECVSPAAPPWLNFGRCIPFYEERIISDPKPIPTNPGAEFGGESFLQFRLVYEHCLQLLGRQQGPLLYTTTLLPGEKQKLYHFDRYRRVTSTQDTFSVQTSFRQYVAALHAAQVSQSASVYQSALTSIQENGDSGFSIGGLLGDLGSLFGLGGGSSSSSAASSTSFGSVSLQSVINDFQQTSQAASLAVDTQRSTVVSTYEDKEQIDITSRQIQNDNDCHAVTYFVRKVMEVYSLRTTLVSIFWRLLPQGGSAASNAPWRSIDDLQGVSPAVRARITADVTLLPAIGQTIGDPRQIALPTDGTVYEAELAHCSSCEPANIAKELIALEKAKADENKACAEAQMLALEVKRRQLLLEKGILGPFVPASNPTPALTPNP